MLGSKFAKFLMSILKRQVGSSSIFVSFFIVITHNFSANFKFFIHFLLWPKGSHQSSNFDTFECSGENLPNSSFAKFSKQQVNFSSNFVSLFNVMKDISSIRFSSNNIYFAQKESIKVKIF